ncbi:hypothetical protein KUTeg_012764 [Tegillarca granosa]|uniref:Uncharacterized protein n=1 Tax=Tegillarca granosa TaxID=220873 RepID=A0ABQ9F0F7_TEGGR|nr:hypothetical protein KUTeg_012764 [Tegillarca granosa]
MDDLEEDTNVKGKGHRSTGAFGVCTLAIGGLKSFGVLFVELSRTYSVSSRALASIQSLTGFFFLGIGPISNALGMRYSHRLVVFTGGVITLVGLVLSSFAKSVEVLYITYGVITEFI